MSVFLLRAGYLTCGAPAAADFCGSPNARHTSRVSCPHTAPCLFSPEPNFSSTKRELELLGGVFFFFGARVVVVVGGERERERAQLASPGWWERMVRTAGRWDGAGMWLGIA